MDININHPSFILFLDKLTASMLTNFPIDSYIMSSSDKKTNIQYLILTLMNNSLKSSTKLSDNEVKSFVIVLMKKNEDAENYELAAVLRDIITNFDILKEMCKPAKKISKTVKQENKNKNLT